MGAFDPHIDSDCGSGSLVTVDLSAPYNIFKVEVVVNGTTFEVPHKVHFDLVDGPWWIVNSAVNTHVDGLTATVTATFYEIDSNGNVFVHPARLPKTVVAPAATGCEVTTTSAPSQQTTTTTAGVAPPPPPPTIGPRVPPTAVVVQPPHKVQHELPATGSAVTDIGIPAVLLIVTGLVVGWAANRKEAVR